MDIIDREIGSTFINSYVGKLEVVEDISCQSCVFYGKGDSHLPLCLTKDVRINLGHCSAAERADGKPVIFIKVEEQ